MRGWPVPACDACGDIQTVATDRFARHVAPCPKCSDPIKRAELEVAAFRKNYSRIYLAPSMLDPKEREKFDNLIRMGVTEPDALRSIEGDRYDPMEDQEFLAIAREEFRKWKNDPNRLSSGTLSSQPASARTTRTAPSATASSRPVPESLPSTTLRRQSASPSRQTGMMRRLPLDPLDEP